MDSILENYIRQDFQDFQDSFGHSQDENGQA
jgi:hypothetical protein